MRQTRYEVPLPIRGPLEVTADRSADSGDWFGEGRSVRDDGGDRSTRWT